MKLRSDPLRTALGNTGPFDGGEGANRWRPYRWRRRRRQSSSKTAQADEEIVTSDLRYALQVTGVLRREVTSPSLRRIAMPQIPVLPAALSVYVLTYSMRPPAVCARLSFEGTRKDRSHGGSREKRRVGS